MSREAQKKLFVELINKQLEPFNKTYDDVANEPNWYMNYKTTEEDQKIFMDYCAKKIKSELGLSDKLAEMEASWFILQWGLTTTGHQIPHQKSETEKVEIRRKN